MNVSGLGESFSTIIPVGMSARPRAKRLPTTLFISDVLEPTDHVLVPRHDWRNAKINVSCLAIPIGSSFPACGKHRDHVAADDSAVSGDISSQGCYDRRIRRPKSCQTSQTAPTHVVLPIRYETTLASFTGRRARRVGASTDGRRRAGPNRQFFRLNCRSNFLVRSGRARRQSVCGLLWPFRSRRACEARGCSLARRAQWLRPLQRSPRTNFGKIYARQSCQPSIERR